MLSQYVMGGSTAIHILTAGTEKEPRNQGSLSKGEKLCHG